MPDAVEVDDRRADLEAAFDKAVTTPETPPVEAPAAPAVEAAPEIEESAPSVESAQKARDEKGRFVPASAAKGNPAVRSPGAGAQEGVVPPPPAVIGAPPPTTPPASVFKPPQSWNPQARELAAKLPAEFHPILEEASRRERETSVAIQRATETTRQVEPLLRAIQPYAQALQSRGMDVTQVVGNFLRTEQALSSPDERVRAQILAQAMPQYRVSVEALAAALDGMQAPVQGQQTQSIDPQQIIQQAKAEFTRELQQQRFQQATESSTAEIEAFAPQAEFLDDVRETTAALLETAARQRVALSLKDAYDQACWADPRIRGILQQREASKQAATGAQATQRAHAAASSVKSRPGGIGNNAPLGDSPREHLEASWNRIHGE